MSAGAILAGVGAGTGAYGDLAGGAAKNAAAKYNAGIAELNAAAANWEGSIAVQQHSRESQQQIGAQKAQYAANGVDSGQGSALDVIMNSNAQAALDSALIKHSYAMKAYGYEATSALDKYEGEQAQTSSYFSATSSLLGGAGKAYSMSGSPSSGGAG